LIKPSLLIFIYAALVTFYLRWSAGAGLHCSIRFARTLSNRPDFFNLKSIFYIEITEIAGFNVLLKKIVYMIIYYFALDGGEILRGVA